MTGRSLTVHCVWTEYEVGGSLKNRRLCCPHLVYSKLTFFHYLRAENKFFIDIARDKSLLSILPSTASFITWEHRSFMSDAKCDTFNGFCRSAGSTTYEKWIVEERSKKELIVKLYSTDWWNVWWLGGNLISIYTRFVPMFFVLNMIKFLVNWCEHGLIHVYWKKKNECI